VENELQTDEGTEERRQAKEGARRPNHIESSLYDPAYCLRATRTTAHGACRLQHAADAVNGM
jgi:hypothetical protein